MKGGGGILHPFLRSTHEKVYCILKLIGVVLACFCITFLRREKRPGSTGYKEKTLPAFLIPAGLFLSVKKMTAAWDRAAVKSNLSRMRLRSLKPCRKKRSHTQFSSTERNHDLQVTSQRDNIIRVSSRWSLLWPS